MKKILFLFLFFINFSLESYSNEVYRKAADSVRFSVSDDGCLRSLSFVQPSGMIDTVRFRSDSYAGPSFGPDIKLRYSGVNSSYEGRKAGIYYGIQYKPGTHYLDICVNVKNETDSIFNPQKLEFYLGIDTYMDKYPEWNNLYFPTFFRCEKNNFWGYLMSPKGRILLMTSSDPIASYNYKYLQEMYGHYIYTVSLDLLCKSPLPTHHPVQEKLSPGEERSWKIRLTPLTDLSLVEKKVSECTDASLIKLNTHSVELNKPVKISTVTSSAEISILSPTGERQKIGMASVDEPLIYNGTAMYGLYWIEAKNNFGKISTASFYVRPQWSWYLKRIEEQALVNIPRADKSNDSCETWYQLLGFYLAEKYFPNASMKNIADKLLERVLDSLFVEKNGLLHTVTYPERIQNVSAMVSILTDKYQVDQDIETLEVASKCVDYLLSRQHEKGYYGGYSMAHYTSVLYIAKAILEYLDQIQPLISTDKKWHERYVRYSGSVKRAMDELSQRGRDIKTEGQQTYEDGAVSCSATQLLEYALLQDQEDEKNKYMKPGMNYLQDHACLTRLLDPDARSRGATSRFWECWGDIHSPIQAMLSPHGWSGWRLYASYYAYLLTGDYKRLQQLMDAMGACTQLLDYPKGCLRYAFVVDPQYAGGELLPDKDDNKGIFRPSIKTTGYIDLIGEWYGKNTEGCGYLEKANWNWQGSGTGFEIFKAMEEIVLCNAFVCENNEEVIGYNCSIEHVGKVLNVKIDDNVVSNIHFNLKQDAKVIVYKNGEKVKEFSVKKGMIWQKIE